MSNHPALTARGGALQRRPPQRLDENPAAIYLARLAPGSRRSQRGALEKIAKMLLPASNAETFPWHQLRYQHTQALRSKLSERYAPATVNKHLAALKGVLQEAWRLELMSAEEYTRATDLKAVRGATLPAGREVGMGELKRLLDACAKDETAAGARDAALIAVLYTGGLRRDELANLSIDNYDRDEGELRVLGKGNKQRLVHLESTGQAALDTWLEVRGDDAGPVFCRVHKTGAPVLQPISGQSVRKILLRRAREADVSALSPHDFRRTFVSHLLEAGVDMATVQKMAGHASINTTARYDRRGEEAKKRAVEKLNLPYRRKKK